MIKLTQLETQVLKSLINGLYAEAGFSDVDAKDIASDIKAHLATHTLNKLFGYRQAKSGAALLPLITAVCLGELLENVWVKMLRDAPPTVCDANSDTAISKRTVQPHRSAGRRKLDGV